MNKERSIPRLNFYRIEGLHKNASNKIFQINIVREFRLHDIHQGSCDGTFKSFPKCGRPLGVRFRKLYRNKLFIADAYHGLYELDIITG